MAVIVPAVIGSDVTVHTLKLHVLSALYMYMEHELVPQINKHTNKQINKFKNTHTLW
jgi:DNA helicase TIP49 (TBP-interacting protein)